VVRILVAHGCPRIRKRPHSRGFGGPALSVPPPHLARDLAEYTFEKLLARLGEKPSTSAECKFVDTIADIAVLGAPDGQELAAEAQAYEEMTEALPAIALAAPPTTSEREARRLLMDETADEAFEKRPFEKRYEEYLKLLECRAWLLSLDGRWFECPAFYGDRMLAVENKAGQVVGGMSGSPVISDAGAAIALVSTGSEPLKCPGLVDSLPGWLLDEILGDANPRRR
jgi:hypothetical protein